MVEDESLSYVDQHEILDLRTKEGLLLKSLIDFFRKPSNLKVMIPIVTETSPVSLRVLDWFITNYSRDKTKTIVEDPILTDFDVYNSYKSQLKAFNKKLFDPFCRLHSGGKIKKFRFIYEKENEKKKHIVTTTGQLNFFKWAIENKIIDYVTKHYKEIKMDLKQKEFRKRKPQRHFITTSISSTITTETDKPTDLSPVYWNPNSADGRKPYVIRFD